MAKDSQPSKILIVEGLDDEHVVKNLCLRYKKIPDFQVKNTGGILKTRGLDPK